MQTRACNYEKQTNKQYGLPWKKNKLKEEKNSSYLLYKSAPPILLIARDVLLTVLVVDVWVGRDVRQAGGVAAARTAAAAAAALWNE